MIDAPMESKKMAKTTLDIHSGHRERMRNKFRMHSASTMENYELLEMLLYHVTVQGDTHPIAKRLLFEFGSIDGVFKADREALMRVERVGPATADFIVNVGKFISLMSKNEKIDDELHFDDFVRAGEYIVRLFQDKSENSVIMLLLDNRLNLIGTKEVYNKSFSSAGVRATPFLNYAVENRASVVITAHTKLGGVLFPLVSERETCKMISNALRSAGVLHLEHYIVSNDKFISTMEVKTYGFSQSAEINQFIESRERYNAR